MRIPLNIIFSILLLLLFWQLGYTQIYTTSTVTYTSANPKVHAGLSKSNMQMLDLSKVYALSAGNLSGGIVANAAGGGKVTLSVYYYNEHAPDGKGGLLYRCYTTQNSESFIERSETYSKETWTWIIITWWPGTETWRSTDIKKMAMKAGVLEGKQMPASGCWGSECAPRVVFGSIPVIVEATVTKATFNRFKLPVLGEFDAASFFRVPPGHGCVGKTSIECETLREFRHGDFEKAIVTAHRGYWGYGDIPEGSMKALENAYNNKYVSIEIDILQTKDGKLVLMHDQAVNRMTNLPDTYEGCFTDNLSSSHFTRSDQGWLKNLNYASTTSNIELENHTHINYPAVNTGKYIDRRGQPNNSDPIATLETALDFVKNKPILLSLDIKEQDQDSYISTLKKCIQAAKSRSVLHQIVFKPGSAARIDFAVYEQELKAAGLWEDFAYKSNVIVILFPPKDNPLNPIPKANVDGWMSLPSLICFEFIYKYDNLNTDALLKAWPEYGNKSVITYVKERGYRTGINWEIATDCRGLPNGRGQWYDRGEVDRTPSGEVLGIDSRNNPEWVTNPPSPSGSNNKPGAIVTDRPDVTQHLLELLGRYNPKTKRP